MTFNLDVYTRITIIACREAHRVNPAVPPGALLVPGAQGDKLLGDAIVEYFKDTGEWDASLLPVALATYRATEQMIEFSGAEVSPALAKLVIAPWRAEDR